MKKYFSQFNLVQSLSHVRLFSTQRSDSSSNLWSFPGPHFQADFLNMLTKHLPKLSLTSNIRGTHRAPVSELGGGIRGGT